MVGVDWIFLGWWELPPVGDSGGLSSNEFQFQKIWRVRTCLPFCSRSFLFFRSSLPHVIAVNPGSDPINRMASTAHQTRDQERNSPSRRAGCLPARRLECPICSPFTESFLLRQIPSCFSAGPRIYTGLSCPAWAPVLYLSFPSVLEVLSFSGQGIPDEPPNVMPAVLIPQQEKIRPPWQCNTQRKGNLLLTRARGPAATNTVVQNQRAPSPSFHAHL